MFGMEMVLSQLGIDPKEIKQKAEQFGAMFAHMHIQMNNIETQNKLIMVKMGFSAEEIDAVSTPPLQLPEGESDAESN